jgi:protoporphyrinogen oxidase
VSKKQVIIVGGGPVGLLFALYLTRVKKKPVTLIEKQNNFGGLYSGFDTAWGEVDHGVHLLQETGIASLDKLFFDILPKDDWLLLKNEKKDIAGNFFMNELNDGSLYPDLRKLGEPDYSECLADLMKNVSLNFPSFSECENLESFLESRFGILITEKVFQPISQKMWQKPLDKMSPWAAKLVHLTRVVIHEQGLSEQLKKSPILDQIIGFSDQLAVSEETFKGQRKSLYPRKFGLQQFIKGSVRELKSENVKLISRSEVTDLILNNGNITSLQITDSRDGSISDIDVSQVIWTSPLESLAKIMGIEVSEPPDKPIPHRVVHLFLDKPPATEKLYWLWSYDGDDPLVRISNPMAYSETNSWGKLFPLCAELHVPERNISDAETAQLAESQLRKRGIINRESNVLGVNVLPSIRWFYLPTVGNIDAACSLREKINDQKAGNLFLLSQNLGKGLFYMSEMLSAGVTKFETI